MGYPQVAFGGAYSVIGDPTTFVSRRNRSAELYENLRLGSRRSSLQDLAPMCSGWRSIRSIRKRTRRVYLHRPVGGNAFADFLLGYPTSAQVGIGRADEHGRTNWWRFYGQNDWRVRSNVTVQLRPALRDQRPDERR